MKKKKSVLVVMSTRSVNKVSKLEIYLYLIIWICSIIYAIYQTYNIGNEYFTLNLYDTFTNGWTWLHRNKDDSDYEWKFGLKILATLLPWFITHISGAEILKYSGKSYLLPLWYCFLGLLFSWLHLGCKATVYFLFQPIVGYIIAQFKRKSFIWLYNLGILLVLNYYDFFHIDLYSYSDYEMHIIVSTLAWINLRCINYFLEATEDATIRKLCFKNFVTVFAYCFYLPLMFLGPLVIYKNFQSVFDVSYKRTFTQKLKELIFGLMKFFFWLVFTEFTLHFVYVNAISYNVQLIKSMNDWALYGLGYCMGQMFHLKYVVFYGFSITLAKFEGVLTPNIPKCIGRIHLYSDMWKYFDEGLYIFLLRYIYIPVCSIRRTLVIKLFASLLCFLYVYVWHGVQNFIAIWTMLNFFGIAIETLASKITKIPFVQKISEQMSPAVRQRLTCFIVTPLFAMSAISNFYFFAGKEVGDIYMSRFLDSKIRKSLENTYSNEKLAGPRWILVIIFSVLYCGSHVSVEIKRREISKSKENIA